MDETRHILIVEDDLDLAEMLTEFFATQGYKASSSAWGQEALLLAAETPPDLIVLDIHLPDIDGYTVCQTLRSNRRTQGIPVIFLTEKRDRTDRLHGLELGVVDYITKPFDIDELNLRVRNTLQHAVRQPLNNTVTGLPESRLTAERLASLLDSDNWGLLAVRVNGLNAFREEYGFVAADDVLRAVSLMINNAIREAGSQDDFVGHLDDHSFLVTTGGEHVKQVFERINARIGQSVEFFYPLKDREKISEKPDAERLRIDLSLATHEDGPVNNLGRLKAALESFATGKPPDSEHPAEVEEIVVVAEEMIDADEPKDVIEAVPAQSEEVPALDESAGPAEIIEPPEIES